MDPPLFLLFSCFLSGYSPPPFFGLSRTMGVSASPPPPLTVLSTSVLHVRKWGILDPLRRDGRMEWSGEMKRIDT